MDFKRKMTNTIEITYHIGEQNAKDEQAEKESRGRVRWPIRDFPSALPL